MNIPLDQILNDYKKLSTNKFWVYYLQEIHNRYINLCEETAKATSDCNESVRVLQGKSQESRMMRTFHEQLVRELETKLKEATS